MSKVGHCNEQARHKELFQRIEGIAERIGALTGAENVTYGWEFVIGTEGTINGKATEKVFRMIDKVDVIANAALGKLNDKDSTEVILPKGVGKYHIAICCNIAHRVGIGKRHFSLACANAHDIALHPFSFGICLSTLRSNTLGYG